MNKPVIFLGPSLTHEKAKKILDADYRPPARKGDLLRFAASANDLTIVGLVDGYFLQDYPPSPIEVYQLIMRKNTVVVGSASLGALRAVELEKFGMIGIGKIFELYKKGIIDADDEVAVTFAEERQSLQSEAMIDIRFNLFIAQRKGIIDETTKRAIARIAKGIYFPYRNYGDILDQTKNMYPEMEHYLESFRSYIINNRRSLKEQDAIRLIKYIKSHYPYE
ncbi:MAG: TfuA-like protein [Nitrososphaeraceae archaeon]